jgi:hypothetical protein
VIEVYPGLFVGDQRECPLNRAPRAGQWATVHAYPPCYREVLGYTTPGAPEGPEQYLVRRDAHLLLNLPDAHRPEFIHKEALIDPALAFIDEERAAGASILIHCEQGWSRSPSLALLYLATRLGALPNESLSAAEAQFRRLYPGYAPGYGIWAHLRDYWPQYCADGRQIRAGDE